LCTPITAAATCGIRVGRAGSADVLAIAYSNRDIAY